MKYLIDGIGVISAYTTKLARDTTNEITVLYVPRNGKRVSV